MTGRETGCEFLPMCMTLIREWEAAIAMVFGLGMTEGVWCGFLVCVGAM